MRGGNTGHTGHTNTLNKKRRARYVSQVQRDRFGKLKAHQLDPPEKPPKEEDWDEKL